MHERIAALDDLWDGEMRGYACAAGRLVLVRIGDGVRAWVDRCPHLGVPLSEGVLADGVITCRAHHYQYDACTGAGVNPRSVQLQPLPVAVVDGEIVLEVEDP